MHMTVIRTTAIPFAAAMLAVSPATAQSADEAELTEPERVVQGSEDVSPNARAQWVDLRVDVDGGQSFGAVYRVENGFMRSQGALRAIFPRSLPMSPRLDLSAAAIPAGTMWQIGEPWVMPAWQARPGMVDGLRAANGAGATPGTVRVRGAVPAASTLAIPGALVAAPQPATMNGPGDAAAPERGRTSPSARAATPPRDASLPERRVMGAASPPRSATLPAIVSDETYRRERLRAILSRALSGPSLPSTPAETVDQAARGRSGSSS